MSDYPPLTLVKRRKYNPRPYVLTAAQRRTRDRMAVYQRPGRVLRSLAEQKFFDTAISFTVDATGEVPVTGQLNLVPQGNTDSTRVGRSITITSINFGGSMTWQPAATTTSGGQIHVWIVLDTQCNKAAATATDVFTSTNFQYPLRNLANEKRFKILRKFTEVFNPEAGIQTAFGYVVKPFSYYKKCNIPITFDSSASTGAIGTITENNLFLLAGTDGLQDDTVTVGGNCRIRFTDA